jgi:hypothetical protein
MRALGLTIFLLTRTRVSMLVGRVWWLLPLVKIAQWALARRRVPVRTVRLRPGDDIHVSLRKYT